MNIKKEIARFLRKLPFAGPSVAHHGLLFILFFLVLRLPPGLAYHPETDDPKLEELGGNFKARSSEYRDALKAKIDFIADQLRQTEDSLVDEEDQGIRRKLVEHLRDLRNQYDQLKDDIRVISAGEVVKLSNRKDKIVSFLTHQ